MRPQVWMPEGFLDSGWKGDRSAGMAGTAGADALDMDETRILLQRGKYLGDFSRRSGGTF